MGISLFSSVSLLAKGIVDTNSCRKYLEILMLFVSVVWEEQKGPPHLLPLPLCCARLGGSTVNRCHVENSQGEVSPPAPVSLQVDPGQSQNWASVSCRFPHVDKEVPKAEFVVS